jgi:2-C-methyl-D-erythritol 4-phosphate cytidylyltransferase
VGEIIVTLPPGHADKILKRFDREFRRLGVTKVVAGGKTRRASVENALWMVNRSAKIVAVHDAARPLVSKGEIKAVIRVAAAKGAAIVALPAQDTIKEVDKSGRIVKTPDRSRLWRALTPQAFHAKLLREAYRRIKGALTDDSQLVEKLGRRVFIVEGTPSNIKITTPADLKAAEALLRGRRG